MIPRKEPAAFVTARTKLAAILAISYLLRISLAVGGGQFFWPDESRYYSAQNAAKAIWAGQWKESLLQLFGHADHVLFRLASLPAALAEAALGGPHPVLVSSYFSLFSVGLIFLIWAVSLRAGASEREALWSAFFGAASSSLFFYSRHFLPYDVALFTLFLALWFGLGGYSALNSAKVGGLVALGVLSYNGYWLLGFAVLGLHVLFGTGLRPIARRRGLWSAVGFCAVVAAVLAIGRAFYPDLIADYRSFSGSIKQGDFRIGYRVISEYLWYSERALLVVWVVAIGYALFSQGASDAPRRLRIWLVGGGTVIAGLVLFSDVIPQFMVYGRLTRQMVPFACLAAGFGMSRFLEKRNVLVPRTGPWVVALVLVLAAANFETPLVQEFPDTFNDRANTVIARQRAQGIGFFRILFAESLWGKHLNIALPPHMELMRSPHPMQFRPFQYEGYSAALRKEINGNDVAMQLVEVPFQPNEDSARWAGFPGPVRIRLRFQPDYWNEEEPLVSTGRKEHGDVVVVRYLDPAHLSLGLVRYGEAERFSDPIAVDFGEVHEILLSEGSFFPPKGSLLYGQSPDLESLRNRLVISLDGVVVLSQPVDFHYSAADSLNWGLNTAGALVPQPLLRSPVYAFAAAPLDQVATAIPTLAYRGAGDRPSGWNGALGPIRMRFALAPPTPSVAAEPLLSINGPGTKDVIFFRQVEGGRIQFGFDRMGAGAIFTKPLPLSSSGTEELDISLGSLMPPADSAVFAQFPSFAKMRDEVYLRFNGVVALRAEVPFTPAPARWFALGANTIGSSTYGPIFRGTITSFGTIGPENIPGIGTNLSEIVDSPGAPWSGFSGPVRLWVVFPQGKTGRREPLLSSGKKGASDTLFVQYDSETKVRFGYARPGIPPVLSRAVSIDPGHEQELLLGSGALMPPDKAPLYLTFPEYDPLRYFEHIGLNGHPLLHEVAEVHVTRSASVWVASNPFSEPTVDARFTGSVENIARARPFDVCEEGGLADKLAREGWDGYPGPLRIKMSIPVGLPGEGQPLVTTGRYGIGDVIFLRYEANGKARVGQDHWGSQLLLSEPFTLDTSTPHTVDVSFGGLYPPLESPLYGVHPELVAERGKTVILIDGHLVLDAKAMSHPSTPATITVGANLIGGTTARSLFSGNVGPAERAPSSLFAR